MSQSLRISRIHLSAFIDHVLWRLLAFARSLQGRSPFLGQLLRRSVLLVWWTATFQLHIHARYWLRARRLRRLHPPALAAAPRPPVDPARLTVPCSDNPLASVIIPSYGQVPLTLQCLASIAAHAPQQEIEVLVIDDASPGADAAELRKVKGIRLIRNVSNLGFLRSCNLAAGEARGTFLLFLNNDTEVQADWLSPLLAPFARDGATGAVGSKLLYPDNRLQEAGGIIWRDGSAWNFGRHEDPSKPEYNYLRQVDYCSGAALLVRRDVFQDMGGFDECYAPAYYEDSDLCLRLRARGLKVFYQPASRIIHHEGASHGRDTAIGIKSYQAANRRRFVRRWAPVLAANHFPHGQAVFRARDSAMHRMIVLVVDHYVPTPDRDAGSRSIAAFLEALVSAGFVVKFWPHNGAYSAGYTEALQAQGIEVFYNAGPFEAWIKRHGHELDHVLLSRPEVAEDVLPLIRDHSAARIVYYGHDLHYRRMRQQADLLGDGHLRAAAEAMKSRERRIWLHSDLSLYPSAEEVAEAAALEPAASLEAVPPYAFDRFAEERAAPANAEILFVAGFGHPPNADAAKWFVSNVMPTLRAAVPAVHLSIVGSSPTEAVKALASEAVSIHPDVTDAELLAFYSRARVAVVPLRWGAGVKLKVVEALREGVPLVTTPVGAQGLPELEAAASVAQEPDAFADAVLRLLRDDAAWREVSRRQTAYARQHFSRKALAEALTAAFVAGDG